MIKQIKILFLGYGEERISLLLSYAKQIQSDNFLFIKKLIFLYIERTYGVYISRNARIGSNVKFRHPTGIVIGDGVIIGDNVTIYQNVTLGGGRIGDAQKGNYPCIGSGTVIFAGAKVIGKIRVGDNCIIGANAVVTKNIPNAHIAKGIPSKFSPIKD